MEFIKIDSYQSLQDQLKNEEKSFLLLYKSDTEKSTCALNNLRNTDLEKNHFNVLITDVNHVRDIHEKYEITTVPTLLEFKIINLLELLKAVMNQRFLNHCLQILYTPL